MQLLSCARAWERLSKLLDELLLVCEVSKVRAAPPPALTQHATGSLIACSRLLTAALRTQWYSASMPYVDTLT